MSIIVYHGGTEKVEHPICKFGRAADYDYIEGGIANDRVIDTINLYMAGIMDEETALRQLFFCISQTIRYAFSTKV